PMFLSFLRVLSMNPPSVVVRFGDSFSVNCSSTSDLIESMGLESRYGSSMSSSGNSFVVLKVESVTDWEFEPICFLNHLRDGQCLQTLPVTVYKTPDTVSISPPSLEGLVEGERYSIQCDIVNVAPVSSLSVHWHRGDAIFYTERFDGSSLSPVNKTSVFNLTAQRGDDETRIWCEAWWRTLELSAGIKLSLDCTAAGKPTPVYSWRSPHHIQRTNQNENQSVLALSIQLPGTYECTASNSQGSNTKYFTVTEATSKILL
uniref:Ig-like domain-containing protein n=1 Tax=Cyclopterus lumpus TaxID=8103 RepID=A0A8C3AJX6_CYCLU